MPGDPGQTLFTQNYGKIVLSRQTECPLGVAGSVYVVFAFKELL